MQIVVVAKDAVLAAFTAKGTSAKVRVELVATLANVTKQTDALLYLLGEDELLANAAALSTFSCPVFVHSVVYTLNELPAGVIRLNAWPGFLERDTIEIAANEGQIMKAADILKALGWKYKLVADVDGMIAARIVAMIINEAWFALGDKVSSKKEIDIAMKLGTNYPYGPFEWGEMIGLHHVLHLLNHLALTDVRYAPAPLLINETRC